MNIGVLPILYQYNQFKRILIGVIEVSVDKVQQYINQTTAQAIWTHLLCLIPPIPWIHLHSCMHQQTGCWIKRFRPNWNTAGPSTLGYALTCIFILAELHGKSMPTHSPFKPLSLPSAILDEYSPSGPFIGKLHRYSQETHCALV